MQGSTEGPNSYRSCSIAHRDGKYHALLHYYFSPINRAGLLAGATVLVYQLQHMPYLRVGFNYLLELDIGGNDIIEHNARLGNIETSDRHQIKRIPADPCEA